MFPAKEKIILLSLICFLILLLAGNAFGQKSAGFSNISESNLKSRSLNNSESSLLAGFPKLPLFPPNNVAKSGSNFGKTLATEPPLPSDLPNLIPIPVILDFHIDWTNCQIHRVSTDSAIVVSLPGTIVSDKPVFWNLSNSVPGLGGAGSVYFIEDIFGRPGPAYGRNIPIVWEISIDDSPMTAVPLQPDGSISVLFPSGAHRFQARLTVMPQYHESDGYYNLQLSQQLVPQL